jgi:Flp pilus assembly protein TadG
MTIRRLFQSDSGQAIAEAALLLPVFVFVAFILIDIEWMLKSAYDIDYIVTETARCEAMSGPACSQAPNSAQSYAVNQAQLLRLSTGTGFQLSTPPCSTTSCTATISYQYQPLGAWFPAITINRTGTAAVAPQPQQE